MAIKDMIGSGIGFTPGSIKFIITRGLLASTAAPGTADTVLFTLYIDQVRGPTVFIDQARSTTHQIDQVFSLDVEH